ncbi:MAG: permease-like cell division protein FtsX [Pseudomonadales bacterium]|jgi:cell division transport system permease protein|nr:permease-like cell division protein FtsX [Pseudomonadales bacterium]
MAASERGGARARPLARPSAASVWLLHHRLALRGTLARLRRDPLGGGLVALTLGIALALPGLLWLAVTGLAAVAEGWDGTPRINVFLAADARERAEAWTTLDEVAAVTWQTPEESLAEFVRAAGFDDAVPETLDALGGNPLPAVAVVTPAAEALAPGRVRALAARLGREPGVEGVQIDLDWVQRLRAALGLLERLTWGLGVLLAGGVLLVTGSLTRMAIEQRREEIVVLRLVGGTDRFVLRPFVYEGTVHGILGGLAAWLLIAAALAVVAGPVDALAASYGSAFRLGGPPLALGAVLLGGGAALGWLGARLAAGRRLRRIEP